MTPPSLRSHKTRKEEGDPSSPEQNAGLIRTRPHTKSLRGKTQRAFQWRVKKGEDRKCSQQRRPPKQRLLTVAALVGTALAIAFLFVGVGHSLIVLSTGRVGESELAIDRGRWELVVGSAVLFLGFLALIPVRTRETGDHTVRPRRSLCLSSPRCSGFHSLLISFLQSLP
jgi:hypothetical protein